MRFGISTHLYHEQPLARRHLVELAEFGYREIELFASIGHFDYHDERAIDELAGWLSDAGLRLHSVHAPIVERVVGGEWGPMLSTAAATEEARLKAVGESVAAVNIARRIPYSYLVTHAGIPDSLKPAAGDNSWEAARRSIEQISAAASPLGVEVAVELIPNAISTAERLVQMLEDELELPEGARAGICLDMGHAFLMGDLVDAIDAVSGFLVTTHVHDNRGRDDDHLPPFDGSIDWPTAIMSLQKVGYEGSILFELAGAGGPRTVLEKSAQARRRFEQILSD